MIFRGTNSLVLLGATLAGFSLLCQPHASAAISSVYLHEGFDSPGVIPPGWIVRRLSGTTATWNSVGTGGNPFVPPYRGAGQAQFNSFDAAAGEQARLVSRSANLALAQDPFLSFAMYHDADLPGYRDSLYVEVSTSDSINGPWTLIARFQRPASREGWSKEFLPMTSYIGTTRLFVSFRGVSTWGNNIYVDEVQVADEAFHDIAPVRLTDNVSQVAPSASPATTHGESRSGQSRFRATLPAADITQPAILTPLNLFVVVQNFGTFSESSYQVRWKVDAQTQPAVNNARTLNRNGRDTITLPWSAPTPGIHLITAWTALATDTNRSNDTITFSLQVLDSTVVFSEGFNGPAFPPTAWLTVNRSGGPLLPWFRGADTSAFPPFEGSGYAADNFQRANGHYIDNYIISPPVAGVNQTGNRDSLLFWTRSVNYLPPATNFPDSLMILLSTAGADTSNFTTLLEYFEVPKTGWIRKGYALSGRVPQNSTVRVAFRYLHYDGGMGGSSSDFVGIDAVQFKRQTPTSVRTVVSNIPPLPMLEQNYPNPFNPATTIPFAIPVTGPVKLSVLNVLGQEVTRLVDGVVGAGRHTISWNASHVPSGCYFIRLMSEGGTYVRKMLLLR